MTTTQTLDEQLAFFEANDYVLMPEVLSRDEVDAANAAIDRHRDAYPHLWSKGARFQSVHCLMGLPELDHLIQHPSFMPLARAILSDNIVFSEFSIMFREGGQEAKDPGWHRDTGVNDKNRFGVTALSMIYYLTDVDETTARYTLIPGSHAIDDKPEKVTEEGIDVKGEVEMIAPAGSVVFVNSGIWHAGKWGQGPRERRTLHLYMQSSDIPQFSQHNIVPRRLWDVEDDEQRRFYSHFNDLTRSVVEAYAD